jgi:transposase InsO family protein
VRSSSNRKHTTVREHMPSSHQRYADWTPERLRRQAGAIGRHTAALVEIILRERAHPEQGFRACVGNDPSERVVTIAGMRSWTGKQIAAETGVSPATVSRVLRRLGLNKLSALEPAEPVRRYEREIPGELIHIDIKKLGRIGSIGHRITERHPGAVNRHHGIGWEFVHVCIDDASRVAFVQVMADQRKESAVTFLEAAVVYFAKLGVRIDRVMTDSCYRSKAFRAACKRLGLRQIFTKPYTPRTNGKAERFIQTALREWAHARAYQNSDQRSAELLNWLHRYNWHRPHGSLKANTPISRLDLSEDNLLRLDS